MNKDLNKDEIQKVKKLLPLLEEKFMYYYHTNRLDDGFTKAMLLQKFENNKVTIIVEHGRKEAFDVEKLIFNRDWLSIEDTRTLLNKIWAEF